MGGEWLKLAGHPCSWGVDYADHPSNPPWESVISCMAEAGYTGTDLGPVGFYDPAKLKDVLQNAKLDLVAGNIFEKVHEPDQLELIMEKTHASCTTLKSFGAKFFVIVPHTAPEREATAGRPQDAPRLSDEKWAQMMEVIKQVAEVVKSFGICCMLHPHAGSWIEYEDEFERALADLPADLVSLCLDTGHCTYAGMDPVAKFKKHVARIPYMQLKDIDGTVLKRLQESKGSFWDGVTGGVFCTLGQGVVDYQTLLEVMKDSGFSGYATVEQDFDNKIDDEERKLRFPAECSKQSVAFLRKVAAKIDEARAPGSWLKLSGHPCSWGVDYADHPSNPPWKDVIACMAEAGYTGTDLGPPGYYDPAALKDVLPDAKLDLVAGNIFEKLHELDKLDVILEKTRVSCTTLKQFGAEFFVIVPHTVPEREATAGRPKDAPRLADNHWAQMMDAIKQVAEVVKSFGICCLLHPHAGTWIEYEDEVERALTDLPADLVSLCLDTGHFTYAGMDPVAKFLEHAPRIPYLQLKDIDGVVLQRLQDTKGSFWDGVTGGVFCILGKGIVDYSALLHAMKANGFSGYCTIEQDFDNKIDDEDRKLRFPAECSKQSVEFLRAMAAQIDKHDVLIPAASPIAVA